MLMPADLQAQLEAHALYVAFVGAVLVLVAVMAPRGDRRSPPWTPTHLKEPPMTDATTISQEQRDELLNIFRGGFNSGITTYAANAMARATGISPVDTPPWIQAQALASADAFTRAIFDDPAVRESITDDLVKMWTTGDKPGLKTMLAHVGDTHTHGPDCTGGPR